MDSSNRTSTELLGLPFEDLQAYLDQCGVGRTHAPKVFRSLHALQRSLPDTPNLGRHADTLHRVNNARPLHLKNTVRADDGTYKLLFELIDGALIESVLLPMRRERYTLCVSTQVGCAMACAFCATGTLGLTRTLTTGELVEQVYQARQFVHHLNEIASEGIQGSDESQRSLSHLVFMGMGEPLHQYEVTKNALRILLDQRGICFSARNVTVSTVGLVPALRRFSEDFKGRVQLALSLHAGTDDTRQKIIPTARKWRLEDLKQALIDHPLPGRRVLMLEYVILPGVNDSDEELNGVAEFTQGLRCIVNLIPFNPFPKSPFRAPTQAEALHVDAQLKARGVPCSIRVTRGQEKAGACGQLALRSLS